MVNFPDRTSFTRGRPYRAPPETEEPNLTSDNGTQCTEAGSSATPSSGHNTHPPDIDTVEAHDRDLSLDESGRRNSNASSITLEAGSGTHTTTESDDDGTGGSSPSPSSADIVHGQESVNPTSMSNMSQADTLVDLRGLTPLDEWSDQDEMVGTGDSDSSAALPALRPLPFVPLEHSEPSVASLPSRTLPSVRSVPSPPSSRVPSVPLVRSVRSVRSVPSPPLSTLPSVPSVRPLPSHSLRPLPSVAPLPSTPLRPLKQLKPLKPLTSRPLKSLKPLPSISSSRRNTAGYASSNASSAHNDEDGITDRRSVSTAPDRQYTYSANWADGDSMIHSGDVSEEQFEEILNSCRPDQS